MKKFLSVILVTVMTLSIIALTACNKKEDEPEKPSFKSATVYAQVREIDGESYKLAVVAMPEDGSQPDGNPDGAQGGNPPEMPGGNPDGAQGGNPPEMPGGNPGGAQGGNPPEMPDGNPGGAQGGNPNMNIADFTNATELIVTISDQITISKNNQTASKNDIVVGSILIVKFDENGAVSEISIIDPNGMPDGMPEEGNYAHGSDEIITEDMLATTIREGYDVNTDTQDKAKKGSYLKYFNNSAIDNVYLSIDLNNWNYMLQNAIDKPTVLADSITIGGNTVEYVGIKTKGNLSLKSVWASDSDRFSFTVNFGKYIKSKNGYSDNQNFFGLSKVAFNNIYGDATLMKEYLSYCLMTELGVDTPAYALVNLYVNDEFWGVYLMLESIDSALSQRTISEKSDYFIKPESMGGDLVYNSALDAYYDVESDTFDFTSLIYADDETLIYPSDRSNPLYNYCGLWENDEDTFADIVDMLPTLFKWIKTLNELSNATNPDTDEYKENVESIVDIDKLIRYFAVNTYLVNLDSYQSEKMQNYALYLNESGKADVMPWDYNFAFGAYGINSAAEMVNFDIDSPLINTTLDERPLLKIIFNNAEYRALYYKYLNDCTIITGIGGTTGDGNEYAANNFASKINAFELLLSDIYANDPTAFYTVDQYETAIVALKTLIKERNTAVLRQLNGDDTPVDTSVNLRVLGDNSGNAPR